MGDLVVVAPVMAAREQALRDHLRGLDPSPLARLPYETHFARFVILPVDGPRLFFSSRFDVSVARYLEALASLPEVAEIWGHCVGGGAGSLLAYLSKHRVRSPYILPAWPEVSVGEVNAALEGQAEFSRFMMETGDLDSVGLAHAFRQRFAR